MLRRSKVGVRPLLVIDRVISSFDFSRQGLLEPVEPASTGVETMSISQGTGLWILRTSVDVMNGVMMEVKGTDAGGDCDEVSSRVETLGSDASLLL